MAILATPSEFLHSEICESLRAALFQVFGSPLPSAGEGLGVRGETAMPRLETSDQNMANAPSLTSRARELRHSDTLAEKLAWKLLRNRQVLHHKFRRQVPLGNAIVDFCCLSLKLVVELDGAGHAHGSQTTRDRQRDRQLEKGGYRVLRFPNGIVLKAPTEFVKKDSGVHRPVGSGSLERASLRKPVKRPMKYPLTPQPLSRVGERGAETLLGSRKCPNSRLKFGHFLAAATNSPPRLRRCEKNEKLASFEPLTL